MTLDSEIHDLLMSWDSPLIANAIELLEVRDRSDGFLDGTARCQFPELGAMAGQALTAAVSDRVGKPGNREGFWELWRQLEMLDSPAVIVMQDQSGVPERVAYCGEVMASMATSLGAVGLITDGGVRDLQEVRAMGFQYFAPWSVVSHANFEITSVGEPVRIFGETIRTGDILHGDGNGVVVLPDVPVGQLREAVERIRTSEARMLEYISSPDFTVNGARKVSGY